MAGQFTMLRMVLRHGTVLLRFLAQHIDHPIGSRELNSCAYANPKAEAADE
jgi:hypothetical protein